ncbi:MAG: hypothetical protein AAB513_02115 [Patescibacteria group bacterium]
MTKDLAKKYFYTSIFLVIISLSLCIVGYYYVFSNNLKLAVLEAEVTQERADAESFKSAESTLRAVAEGKERLGDLFLGKTIGEKAKFITSIEEMAESIPVQMETSLSSQQVPKENRFQYFVVQGTARGGLDGIYKLLLLLENYPKALEVPRIEIEKIPTDPKQKQLWRMSFVARTIELK